MLTLQQIEQQYPETLRPFKRGLLREYLQYKILEIMFASEYASKLSFLGGTALRIVYGNSRFSEDLDFDNFGLNKDDFDDLAQNVRVGLEADGLKVEVDTVAKGAYRCRVRLPKILFINELSPHQEEKVLVQIDSLAHDFAYRPDKKILNKFDVFSEIFVTPPDILLSQKIYAAINRKRSKGRDFYDIIFLFSLVKPNYAYLQAKIGIRDAEELRKKLMESMKDFDFKELGRDVQPFLFNAADARKVELFPEFIAQASLE
ncbi:MAG TPA: nucleotidyl transferase AbiEii/AbiGii toxin family protein [Patescibacteria group bacterium]|nr:nucleotidyl transferase AbiEii/AbiGii toxin family protein [Patescibacteria group bacterium]